MEPKMNILVDKNDFINHTHNILDSIHGKNTIALIFQDLEQDMLENLICIYNSTFFQRYYAIYSALTKYNVFKNKPFKSTFITSIYICAMQHYI